MIKDILKTIDEICNIKIFDSIEMKQAVSNLVELRNKQKTQDELHIKEESEVALSFFDVGGYCIKFIKNKNNLIVNNHYNVELNDKQKEYLSKWLVN